MKASVLLGAGWEDDSLDVLWRNADLAFCRLRRDVAEDGRHASYPSIPPPIILRARASTVSHTNTNFESTWTARGRCSLWN
jgi:hypothetical protein